MKNNLTAEYVRSILDYDPLTGKLIWDILKQLNLLIKLIVQLQMNIMDNLEGQ